MFLLNAALDLGLYAHTVQLANALKAASQDNIVEIKVYENTNHLTIIGLVTSKGVANANMITDSVTFMNKICGRGEPAVEVVQNDPPRDDAVAIQLDTLLEGDLAF